MDAGWRSDWSVFPEYGSDRSALNEYMNPQYINISTSVIQCAVYVRKNDGLSPIHKRERPCDTVCCLRKGEMTVFPQYINPSARVIQYAVYVRENGSLSPIHKRERTYYTACCSVKGDRNKTPVCRGVQGGLPTWHLNGVSVSESSGDFQRKS